MDVPVSNQNTDQNNLIRTMQSDLNQPRTEADFSAINKRIASLKPVSDHVEKKSPKPAVAEKPITPKPATTQVAPVVHKEEKKIETPKLVVTQTLPSPQTTAPSAQAPTKEVQPLADSKPQPLNTLGDKVRGKEKQRSELIIQQRDIERQETPFLKKIEELSLKLASIRTALEPLIEEDNELTSSIQHFRNTEAGIIDPEERNSATQRRYELEDRRKVIEEKKWNLEKEAENIEAEQTGQNSRVNELRTRADVIAQQVTTLDKDIQRIRIQDELDGISKRKEELELEWIDQNDRKTALQRELDVIIHSLEITQKERTSLEDQERTASNSKEEREVEQLRHDVEVRLRDYEKKRFDTEKAIQEIDTKVERLKPGYQEALEQEEFAQKRLDALL